MYCRQCGTEIREGAAFCPHCGAKVNPATASDTGAGRQKNQTAGRASVQPGQAATALNSGLFLAICCLLTAFVVLIFVDHISWITFLSAIPGAITCVGAWQAYLGSRKQPVSLSGCRTLYTGLYLWFAGYLFILLLYIAWLVIAIAGRMVSADFPPHATILCGDLFVPVILYVVLPGLTLFLLTGFISQILTVEGAYQSHTLNPLAKKNWLAQNTGCLSGAIIMGCFALIRLINASGVANMNTGISSRILAILGQNGWFYHWYLSSIGWVDEKILAPLADWNIFKDIKDLLALAMAVLVIILATKIRRILKKNDSV